MRIIISALEHSLKTKIIDNNIKINIKTSLLTGTFNNGTNFLTYVY